ncbi:pyridoxamine kinase [Fusobacterium sp. PH5-44]|uniref:pyridoxamine kinase n=1 Tax=unclassified Fusobacterium TaxID=2648384 RepID=UPI003D19A773
MLKNILLINDIPGYGKVAIAAMTPILSSMGYSISNLPTALVSNTLNYEKFQILDTTDYMKNTIQVWKELKFNFDCICTGFIASSEQVNIINGFIEDHSSTNNVMIIVDPIMGDYGKLYHGVPLSRINDMKNLMKNADIAIPNFTEATFMCDFYAGHNDILEEDIIPLIDKIRNLGAKSVVITSINIKNSSRHLVCGYDRQVNKYFSYEYEHIPIKFPGTGDIFSSILTGHVLNGKPLSTSVKKAMDGVKFLIEKSKDTQDTFRGILIESFINQIMDI